jgi:hypothetical protein
MLESAEKIYGAVETERRSGETGQVKKTGEPKKPTPPPASGPISPLLPGTPASLPASFFFAFR